MSPEYLSAQLEHQVHRARLAADELADLITVSRRAPSRDSVLVPAPLQQQSSAVSPPKKTRWPTQSVLLGVGIGAGTMLLMFLLSRKTAKASLQLEPIDRPQQEPIHPPAPPGPLILEEVLVQGRPAVASWSSDKKTLNTLSGFHRAKKTEVGPDAVLRAPEIRKTGNLGDLVFFDADSKTYAAAIEEHTNIPGTGLPGGAPHKGISMFVENPP